MHTIKYVRFFGLSIQVILILFSIFFSIAFENPTFYFVVGPYQFISNLIILMIGASYPTFRLVRKYYFLAATALLIYAWYFDALSFMMLSSPVLALWYLMISVGDCMEINAR